MFENIFSKEEKAEFVEFISKLSVVDNECSDDERELVESYKKEFGINEIPDNYSLKVLTDRFAEKEIAKKKVLFFEAYGMLIADGHIGKEEKMYYELLKKKLGFSEKEYDRMIKSAENLRKAYDQVYSAVFD